VYGTLTESERLEVARGPVPVRALSQKMRDVLAFEVLMRPYGTFPSVDQNVVRQANEKESAAIDEYQQLIDTGIYNESTFLLPNGLTGSETLSSKEENTISLVAGAPPGVPDGIGRVMSPESLGRILAQRDYQEFKFSTIGIFQPDLNAIWICNRRSIIITLKPNKLAQFTWTVLDTTLSVNKKLRIEELPESILSRVRDAEAKARREFDRMRAVRSDEKVTPPPQ
ncbi:MAG TPA: hypothetical protein VK171_03835, partial [Fimbriimonas sp.]|nr:hypothetical protein [Fimbriimonas sp.]